MLLIPVKENIKQDTANPNRNPKANSLFGGVSKAQMQVAYLLMIRHQSTFALQHHTHQVVQLDWSFQ